MILDGDENKNYLEASVVSVLEESGQATGDKLHAEAEGDDVLVGRDGQKPKPYRPATLSCIVVVRMFEYLVLCISCHLFGHKHPKLDTRISFVCHAHTTPPGF